jgi:hypothetical protein
VGIEGRIRARVIGALKEGKVQHEMLNGQVNSCDLFQSGQVSAEEVIEFLKPSRGLRFKEVPHPTIHDIKTIIFQPNVSRGGLPVSWYVKCHCLLKDDDEIWFVGVYSTLKRKTP